MEYKNYYQILGIDKQADDKDIKKAYRRLARQYHPDKNQGDKQAEEKFKAINEAYEVLGNPQNRAKYDQLGQSYHRYQQMGGRPTDFDFSQWFSQAGQQQGTQIDFGELFGNQGSDFSSFFTSIFGGTASRPYQQSNGRTQPPSNDIEQVVEISLEEAYRGASRTFSQNGSQFTARIPAGAKTGSKIRLRGKGRAGRQGTGDLYLTVQVLPHDTFRRAGNNLEVTVDVDVVTAVLGGQATVPTFDGPVKLKIPAGTQGSQVFRLAGKGMPHLRQPEQHGDLLAQVRITTPTQLTADERALYQQLAELAQARA
ncbi:MAG: J domain-containing protein [Ardenticatenaceae bacterium]|nr:J domain-containing protein [Ardenticatenaceae bacterium]